MTAKAWLLLTSPIAEVAGSQTPLEALRIQVQSDPTAWVPLGTAHRATGDTGNAVAAYKHAIKARPYDYAAHEMLADTYWFLGEYKKSIQTLENCVQQDFDEETLVGFGWAYIHLDSKKAIEYFQLAMESNPDFAPAYKGLGDVFNLAGDSDKTIEMYQKALEVSPTSSFLWSGIGEAYLAKQMLQDSIEAYRHAVQTNPRDWWAWTCIGDAYRQNKQYDQAIAAFWTSIEGNPRDSWPWKGLAESYREKGGMSQAIAIYTYALQRLRDFSLFISIGLVFKEQGYHDIAIRNFTDAITRAPFKRRLLFAYLSLPTSHLFSNYPLVSLDSNLPKFLMWTHMVECLRERQDSNSHHPVDVKQHGEGATDSPAHIIQEAIREYRKALQLHKHNRLLWVYSAYSASRGFPPFEQKQDLPREVLDFIGQGCM